MILDDRAGEIGRLYAEGRSIPELARLYGVGTTTVSRLMRRHGIPSRPFRRIRYDSGADHPRWKGDAAGYEGFHHRVRRLRGTPSRCDRCGATDPGKIYDWANLTGNYPDPDDYQRMCRTCHSRYDNSRHEGLSAPQAAARLGVTRPWVNMLIKAERLEARRIGTSPRSPYRITEQALAAYLAQRAS